MFSGVRLGKWWVQFMLSLGCQPAHSLLFLLCGCSALLRDRVGEIWLWVKGWTYSSKHVSLLERMKHVLCNAEQGKRKQI